MKVIAGALIAMLGLTGEALAWGSEGHRIVAEIAEQYLEPATAHQVRDLLALENATTLAQVSTWADDIRPQRRESARWHYVNIPIHPTTGTPAAYDAARDCPRGDCVVEKINEFTAVLHDTSAAPRERLEALKFLVHFIADIHQPLHCADDGDRGGNDIHVTFLGKQTNLHAVWDSGILDAAQIGDERAYALHLVKTTTSEFGMPGGSPADWANGSYSLARQIIYGELRHEPGSLPASYEQSALPVVNLQLWQAGVRLAAVLNAAVR